MEQEAASQARSRGRSLAHGILKAVRVLFKSAGLIIFAIVLFVVVLLAAFFMSPELTVSTQQARSLANRFLPGNIQLRFSDFTLRILRPKDGPNTLLTKMLELNAKDLCFAYEAEAVKGCTEDIRFAATIGWGGERGPSEAWYMPRLISIDPLRILGADVKVDLPSFPKEDPKNKKDESSVNVVEMLRKDILPKWQVQGSRVELRSFLLKTSEDAGAFARLDITTEDNGKTVRFALHEARSLGNPIQASAEVRLARPPEWIDGRDVDPHSNRWKVAALGNIDLGPGGEGKARGGRSPASAGAQGGRGVRFDADANLRSWGEFDFRLQTKFKGIAALREIRLDGDVKQVEANGRVSVKMGAAGAEVQALDFVNCDWTTHLKNKTGGLRCGPQTVRMQVRERSLLQDRRLFTFAPEFDLKLSRINFGETKSADVALNLALEHYGIFNLRTHLDGSVVSEESGLRYSSKGDVDFFVPQFQRVVKLLAKTPFAVPAPLNVLDGPMGFRLGLDLNETAGRFDYQSATRLDSKFQAVHLTLDGETRFERSGDEVLKPKTNVTLAIDRLNLSAPRFDFRSPPLFRPDPRFGPINEDELVKGPEKAKESESMDFRLRIKTSSTDAIRLATNLTKEPIPLSVDLVYDDRKGVGSDTERQDPARGPASVMGGAGGVPVTSVDKRAREEKAESTPALTGWVRVGRTPVELFRRAAVVEELRVDLLKDGQQRLNGRVAIRYLDYAINVLLLGKVSDPDVRFTSDPVLDDDQILAVLLFGRPLNELGEDERSSVSSLNSAFADAVLGVSSLYLLASTPIESIGYDPDRQMVTAKVGLGGGASLEVGGGAGNTTGLGFRKRLGRNLTFRSDVERLGSTGKQTVSALLEWVKRF